MPVRSPEREIAPDRAAAPAAAHVARIPGKYLSITSFRRDGSGVATPVWFATESDRLFVMTALGSGKVRRIRRNPFVSIAACSARGRLRSEPMTARAEILPSTKEEHVKRLIARKYRFDLLFIRPIRALQGLFHPDVDTRRPPSLRSPQSRPDDARLRIEESSGTPRGSTRPRGGIEMRRSIVTCNSRPRAKCATNDRVEWRFRLDSASDLGFCL